MEVLEKIKKVRQLKGWTQEKMAEKLGMSVNGYGNIERGKTAYIPPPRLKQIAEVFEMESSELLGGDDKNVFNVAGTGNTNTHFGQWYINSDSTELIELKHELEKCRLLLEQQRQENAYLKKIISLMEQGKG